MTSYIKEYAEAINRGKITIKGETVPFVVGWKIEAVVERILGYMNDKSIIFNPEHAHKRMAWQEHFSLQGKKPYYKAPISLMLWQKMIWEATYGFYDKATGLRLVNEMFLEVARKNGKSTFVASDINYDLFIGEGGVNICCASNVDKQAKFIWSEVAGMRKRLDGKNELTSQNLTEIRNDAFDIKILRMSDKTENKDGDNFVKFVFDEAHEGKDADLPEAGKRSMSTQDDWLFFTTSTNGFLIDKYYDKQLEFANAWLNGEIEDKHYLPFLFEQDAESEVWAGDRNLWQKANPSLIYGVKKWRNIENDLVKAQLDRETRMHLLTKDFNIKASNAEAWLLHETYAYTQEVKKLDDFKGHFALGAVDLSDCGDLTVAKILIMRKGDETKYIFTQYFIPESKLDDKDNGADYRKWSTTINPASGEPYIKVCKGNRIEQKAVADWLYSLSKKHNIRALCTGYDRWHSDVFLLWMSKKEGYGMDTIAIDQRPKELSFAMKMVERDLQAKLINYGNNPVDQMCFANTTAKMSYDRGKDYIMPDKIGGQYSRKIDGTACLIILYATLYKKEMEYKRYLR